MPDTTLTSAELDELWSDDWSSAPRDGSNVLLRLHNGGIHIQRWSKSYSVFGLGGCWTDGFCTMGDKIDYSHWSAGSNLDAMLYQLGRFARVAREAGKAEEWLPIETAPRDGWPIQITNGKQVHAAAWNPEVHGPSHPWVIFEGVQKHTVRGCCDYEDEARISCNGWFEDAPTHWRNLSDAPAIRALPLTGAKP